MNDDDLIPPDKVQMDQRDILQMRLAELRRRHRELDDEITELSRGPSASDVLTLKRLKKEKLSLRDQIVAIEDQLTPDIIA